MRSFNRELKTLNNKTGDCIKFQIREVIEQHDRYSKAFFWTPKMNASQRRKEEFDDSFEFILSGEKVSIEQTLRISCQNYYYSLKVYVNGKKKDVRVLKKLVAVPATRSLFN